MAFPKDRLVVKALAYGLYILETVQTVLATIDIFSEFATGWGNLKKLVDPHLSWLSIPIFSGISEFPMMTTKRLRMQWHTSLVSCAVQMYFAYRISILSRSRTIAYLICAVCSFN